MLRRTQAQVTVVVEEVQEQQLLYLQNMLQRLARYGDRIYISVAEPLRARLNIDSSVFHLVLEPLAESGARS